MSSSAITFLLDSTAVTIDFSRRQDLRPTTTLLQYLRSLPDHKGTKEGCAEGDCGACTVVLAELDPTGILRYTSVDSCLVFLPMIHGKQVITIEHLADGAVLHPVQQSLAENHGTQCGFCTPGVVMSMFALYKNDHHPSREAIDDALTGNLCRCTGYRPIVEATARACIHHGVDRFSRQAPATMARLRSIPKDSLAITAGQQSYHQPSILSDALLLKAEHPDAIVISGATDIALRVTKRHETLTRIIDLSRVPELREVEETNDGIILGAGVPLSTVSLHVQRSFPALNDMLKVFGSPQIRHMATLGGNLGTASPIGDTLPVLMAYGAKVIVESVHGRRKIDMDFYVTGYRQTARNSDEIVTAVKIRKPDSRAAVKFYKISKRKDLDISTLSGGFRVDLDKQGLVSRIVLAYGGMAELTKRASQTETFLMGKPWERQTVEQAMTILDCEFSPISDARSGAEFRHVAARNLLMKFWDETQRVGRP